MKHILLICCHFALMLLAYTAWLWLDYRILIVLSLVHLLVLEVFRGCPLSHAQFPDDQTKRFYEWWMGKLGIQLAGDRRRRVNIFMKYILPLIIVTLAVITQVILSVTPVISL